MTLVIAIQHPSWVLIGADRLLSEGRVTRERKAVKALFYLSDLVWGYSGIARVYDKSNRLVDTDRWFAQTLADIGHRPADKVIGTCANTPPKPLRGRRNSTALFHNTH